MFESIKALTVVKGGVEKLYAFYYKPGGAEKRHNGWAMYDPVKEYQRMGVGTDRCKGWRISTINRDYVVSIFRGRYILQINSAEANLAITVFSNISCISGGPSYNK